MEKVANSDKKMKSDLSSLLPDSIKTKKTEDTLECMVRRKTVMKHVYDWFPSLETGDSDTEHNIDKKPILLFDLNGVLCVKDGENWIFRKGLKSMFELVLKVFDVGVYSSKTKKNVE